MLREFMATQMRLGVWYCRHWADLVCPNMPPFVCSSPLLGQRGVLILIIGCHVYRCSGQVRSGQIRSSNDDQMVSNKMSIQFCQYGIPPNTIDDANA